MKLVLCSIHSVKSYRFIISLLFICPDKFREFDILSVSFSSPPFSFLYISRAYLLSPSDFHQLFLLRFFLIGNVAASANTSALATIAALATSAALAIIAPSATGLTSIAALTTIIVLVTIATFANIPGLDGFAVTIVVVDYWLYDTYLVLFLLY